jgi:hypothetical protein
MRNQSVDQPRGRLRLVGRVLVRNRAPANWPRESVEDGNDQLDGDQTLDILLGFAMVHVSILGWT